MIWNLQKTLLFSSPCIWGTSLSRIPCDPLVSQGTKSRTCEGPGMLVCHSWKVALFNTFHYSVATAQENNRENERAVCVTDCTSFYRWLPLLMALSIVLFLFLSHILLPVVLRSFPESFRHMQYHRVLIVSQMIIKDSWGWEALGLASQFSPEFCIPEL